MSAFVEFLIWLDPFAVFISALIVFLPREHPNKLPGAIRYKLYRGPCQFISKYTALPLPCFLRRSATKWRASSTAQPSPRRILAPRDVTTCAPPALPLPFPTRPRPVKTSLPAFVFIGTAGSGWPVLGWMTRPGYFAVAYTPGICSMVAASQITLTSSTSWKYGQDN